MPLVLSRVVVKTSGTDFANTDLPAPDNFRNQIKHFRNCLEVVFNKPIGFVCRENFFQSQTKNVLVPNLSLHGMHLGSFESIQETRVALGCDAPRATLRMFEEH